MWFTVYDEPRPVVERRTQHRNGAAAVVGLVFDLPAGELGRLAELVEDVAVWPRDALPSNVTGKEFPLAAVVLEAPSLAPFGGLGETSFRGEPAALLRTNPRCWDLLIRAAAD